MTFRRLLFSGVKVGAMSAMRGSFFFTLIAIPVLGGDLLFSLKDFGIIIEFFLLGFIFGVVSCLMYSVLLGILGGIILALWLSKRKINSPPALWVSGGFVGGFSGLLISFFYIFRMAQGG